MKRNSAILIILLLACAAAAVYWRMGRGSGEKKPEEQKPAEEEGSSLSHDEAGRVVVKMDDETQGKLGLTVAKPETSQVNPELKAYGKVLDPGALAALMTELATAKAAYAASSNEFARLKTLVSEGNTSESKVQTAQAAALRDQLAVQSSKDRLALSWGKGVADQPDLPMFVQSLTGQAAVLVRLDLPVGDTLTNSPTGARICALSGKAANAEFLGTTSNVDPQTLGRGAVFLIKPNSLGLLAGEAVTGYIELPGLPQTGVVVPATAVVRTEGRGWIYVMNSGADAFTRIEISLDHGLSGGWFVEQVVSTNDYVVVTGAQSLLSEELKGSIKAD